MPDPMIPDPTIKAFDPEDVRLRQKVGQERLRQDEIAIRQARERGLHAPGTGVASPWRMPRAGWGIIFKQTFAELGTSQISLAAAGCAFYATLSLFPALTTLISLYGLAFSLETVEPQLQVMRNLLPHSAYDLIGGQIHNLVSQPHSSLTIGLVFSLTVALWSASAATKSILSALSIAYGAEEKRGFLAFQAFALATTLCAVLGAVLTLALMVGLPALVDFIPVHFGLGSLPWPASLLMGVGTRLAIRMGGPVLMLLFVLMVLSILYQYGTARTHVAWRWILPGSLLATIVWVVASLGFSYYVGHYAAYSATYGPLGAVAAVMMWLWVSAYVVLFGAEVNAALEDRVKGRQPKLPGLQPLDAAVAKALDEEASDAAEALPAKNPPDTRHPAPGHV